VDLHFPEGFSPDAAHFIRQLLVKDPASRMSLAEVWAGVRSEIKSNRCLCQGGVSTSTLE